VRLLEEQFRTLGGVDKVYSWSREGEASVEVIFDRGHDMKLARAELRDRIERARPLLPAEVERIQVWSWSEGDLPLMFFALLHDGASERNDQLIDTVVQRRLEAVDGVSRVQLWGMLDDAVEILLDEDRVRAAQLDVGALIRRLRQDNFTEPLGEVQDGGRRVLLRSDMRFRSLEEIERFPLGDGLVLADVGRVVVSQAVRDNMSRIDGQYAYFGQIGQESTANVVETARRVRSAFAELERDPQLAGRFRYLTLFSQGDFIEASLGQLRDTALWGGALAALVLFLFLRRVRVTICVALSIPVSALLALTWEHFSGGTFNVLTMTGITLAIGMLVDNSVVVIENIARLRGEGRPAHEAAAEGARDVGLAVSLATLTTVVVFLPLIFMAGDPMLKIMFAALGMPLCLSLLFSLMVALVFLPVATARILGPRPRPVEALARLAAPVASIPARVLGRVLEGLRLAGYGALLGLSALQRLVLRALTPLRWPLALALAALFTWRFLAARHALDALAPLRASGLAPPGVALDGTQMALVLFGPAALVGVGLALFGLKRWRARPAAPPLRAASPFRHVRSLIDLLVSSNGRLLAWTMEQRLFACGLAALALLSILVPTSRMTITSFGQDENRSRIDVRVQLEHTLDDPDAEFKVYEDLLEQHRAELGFAHLGSRFSKRGGRLSLYWEEAQPPGEIARARRRLEELWPRLPGHRVYFYGDESVDTRNRSMVTFQLEGPEADELARLGQQAIRELQQIEGLSGVTSPIEPGPEQVHVRLDDELAWNRGVTADLALQNIAWALRGVSLPRYHQAGRELPFFMGYDDEEVVGLDTLRELDLFTAEGMASLASVARLEFTQGPRSIFRRNGRASFTIQGRVDDPDQQKRISAAGQAVLRAMDLPRGYSVADEESIEFREGEEMQQMKNALLLSVVLVFLLMAILFESVLLPFSVLFTIPFAIVGAVWTLYLTGTAMDSVGWIGLIILVGVVVNNGIVLIDRVHRLRMGGTPRTQAVLDGSRSRVRPIVMTAMTTIFGLLPMALSSPPSEGIDYRALATCVAGGLAISTFFTLWVVPLAYTLMDDLGRVLAGRLSWALGLAATMRRPRATLE